MPNEFNNNNNNDFQFNNNNDYWNMGVMPMNDLWADTWDRGSNYYHDESSDAVEDVLQ